MASMITNVVYINQACRFSLRDSNPCPSVYLITLKISSWVVKPPPWMVPLNQFECAFLPPKNTYNPSEKEEEEER